MARMTCSPGANLDGAAGPRNARMRPRDGAHKSGDPSTGRLVRPPSSLYDSQPTGEVAEWSIVPDSTNSPGANLDGAAGPRNARMRPRDGAHKSGDPSTGRLVRPPSSLYDSQPTGEVAEWSIVPDSKSGVRSKRTVGSNPTLSATQTTELLLWQLFLFASYFCVMPCALLQTRG
jgi:hypothetical protein